MESQSPESPSCGGGRVDDVAEDTCQRPSLFSHTVSCHAVNLDAPLLNTTSAFVHATSPDGPKLISKISVEMSQPAPFWTRPR